VRDPTGEFHAIAHPDSTFSDKLEEKLFTMTGIEKIWTEEQLFIILHTLENILVCHGCSSIEKHIQIFHAMDLVGRKRALTGKILHDTIFSNNCEEFIKKKQHCIMCVKCAKFKRAFLKRVKRYVPLKNKLYMLQVNICTC